ncbi:MAG: serine/threonine protein kinase [Herpetosiphonaceae bacterium]|nr:serine/threonine protein kinase [Herpetosiphonaceae bacterium]
MQDQRQFQHLNWSGTFEEYLDIIANDPKVTRNAFQRIYDMIMSYGTEDFIDAKKKLTRYNFFTNTEFDEQDAIFGLEIPLMRLVNFFKAAAQGYGTEKRVLLLHGPVGSAKSTIARRLKRGLERYSRTDDGALYTFDWYLGDIEDLQQGRVKDSDWEPCPMHEEPLHLIPAAMRENFTREFNQGRPQHEHIAIQGDLDPSCRFNYRDLMRRYDGDWSQMINHIRVRRFSFSEQDRVGIGTFQPKDEKNQDSTELTGDINYRKIAIYGSDSDPRAFNFDGEFNVANRGIIEFVEILKLDTAFLYDLLGASQEHRIKSKKFAQTDIDEVILGHSVAGDTPIPYRFNGKVGWTTIQQLTARFEANCAGLEVMAYDWTQNRAAWTPVKATFKHKFTGNLITTSQKWGVVETTPNHSIYGIDGNKFYPEEQREVMAVRWLDDVLTPADETVQSVNIFDGIEGLAREAGIRAEYHLLRDEAALKDVISLLLWSSADPVAAQAERLQAAFTQLVDAELTDHFAPEQLVFDSPAMKALAAAHCGSDALEAKIPDFIFGLPRTFLEHAYAELQHVAGPIHMNSDPVPMFEVASPTFAAQLGLLASTLGYEYVVRRATHFGYPTYEFQMFDPADTGRNKQTPLNAAIFSRPVEDEWVYDIECEGIHNFVAGVGNIVCKNTNEPEFRKLENNEFMEALKDRTVRIDIPYITRLRDEIQIYEKDFNAERVRVHIAPHTIEMAAMWAVLTRLEEPKRANLTMLQKLKLYNGKTLPGFTEDNIKELRKEARREGMEGISPRYIQDKISNALVNYQQEGGVNPFMVMNELESGLKNHSLITSEEDRKRYRELLAIVKDEYADIVKNEVQRAISADEEAVKRLCGNYIDNIKAYTQREKVRNKFTGSYEEPDERLMRSIEEKIDIPDSRKDDFRREIMNYIGALAVEGKTFDYRTNERLNKALELKLFEDQKDSIKLTSLVSSVVDKDTQEKIDVVKARLIRDFGYNEHSASDVLNYVASIFARGDTQRK